MEITKVKIFSPTGQEIVFDKTIDSTIKNIFFEDDVLGIDFINDEDSNVAGPTVTFEKVPLEITYGNMRSKFKELDFEKLIKEDFKDSKDPNNTPKYYRIPCPYCGNYEVIEGREPSIEKDEITLFCECPQCSERWSQTYEYSFRGEYNV
jgi:DNA-directed RNA polymerase subunit M/transcription elongation factor TFIIS